MPHKGKTSKGNRTTNGGKEWVSLLERAKSALYKNKLNRSRLMAAIRLFEQKIANKEPWPCELSDGINKNRLRG